ncbi:hypothetical protein [Dyella sp. S184]|uniref:hypothetical protein n=1 Tax=Dyella sp. S184 TaxID=1641862 RepID=UPI00131D0F9A|nr:hypothetical protein [Dyella sp. S184]
MLNAMPNSIFEQFLSPAGRAAATSELASRGALALPVLVSLFDGSARNNYGIPYRQVGVPLDCGLVAARSLGVAARPLEPFLRNELRAGHPYAAGALGALGLLSDESVCALAEALRSDPLIACEAAAALSLCSATNHAAVKEVSASSTIANKALAVVSASV